MPLQVFITDVSTRHVTPQVYLGEGRLYEFGEFSRCAGEAIWQACELKKCTLPKESEVFSVLSRDWNRVVSVF